MRRRVAITGIGLVSPHGDTPDGVFDGLLAGRSAITRWDEGDAGPAVVARAPFDVARWFSRLQLAGVDRVSQLAVAAAEMAQPMPVLRRWTKAQAYIWAPAWAAPPPSKKPSAATRIPVASRR